MNKSFTCLRCTTWDLIFVYTGKIITTSKLVSISITSQSSHILFHSVLVLMVRILQIYSLCRFHITPYYELVGVFLSIPRKIVVKTKYGDIYKPCRVDKKDGGNYRLMNKGAIINHSNQVSI